MMSISNNTSSEIVIKNSKFICNLYKVNSLEEINTIITELHSKYSDATHICYAYRLENSEKCFDDKEPSGTAGAPIMEILKKNDLVNVLAVVIRYYGGIKLGAGGLIRAYSKSVRETLNTTTIEKQVFYNYYVLLAKHEDLKLLNNLTKDLEVIKKEFGEEIVYRIRVDKDYDNINDVFKNTNIKVMIFV